jgi:hypothetical protein
MFREKRKDKEKIKFFDKLEWYHYFLLLFSILLIVLIYRKLTRQTGTWSKNLNINKIYIYRDNRTIKEPKDSKGETECRRFLETLFQLPFPKVRPTFLKNPITGNNLEIDCYNSTLRLGIEYNGKQHYSFTSFFHRNVEASNNQKYRDELKRRMCRENGITLIEVPYTIKLNDIGPYLYLKLKEKGYIE